MSLRVSINGTMIYWIVLVCSLVSATQVSSPVYECIDFSLDRIDAISTLQNGSTLLVSGHRYWILQSEETPSIHSGRPVSNLLGAVPNSNDSFDDNRIVAAVNVRISANHGECRPTNEIVLYSFSHNSSTLTLTVFENDQRRIVHDHTHIDYFAAAKSIIWSRPIDAITYWQNTVIIFQNHQFVSVVCRNGEWRQEFVKRIPQVFPGLPLDRTPDSVTIRGESTTFDVRPLSSSAALIPTDPATVYLFYGQFFYECDVTGTDVCEGPYGLMSEFFNVHSYCGTSRAIVKVVLIIVLVLFFGVVGTSAFVLVCHFICQSRRHMRYFVNGKQFDREQTSYEALKMSNENHNLTTLDEILLQTETDSQQKTLKQ